MKSKPKPDENSSIPMVSLVFGLFSLCVFKFFFFHFALILQVLIILNLHAHEEA